MTDRANGLLIALEYNVRDDDPSLLALIDAIKQFKNVAGVTTNISTPDSHIAEMRVKTELLAELSITLRRALQ